jgi:hypothetical protein
MYITIFADVVFIEGNHLEATTIKPIEVSIKGMFTHAQLKSLDDVKQIMVKDVHFLRGNAIINFNYGQASSFWDMFFNLDDVKWYGKGIVAKLPDGIHRQLIAQYSQKTG